MCGRHPRVKMFSALQHALLRSGAPVMCPAFCAGFTLLAKMPFATSVPIIPTASKAAEGIGLSVVSFPSAFARISPPLHPHRSFGRSVLISGGPAHSVIAEPYAVAARTVGRCFSMYVPPRTISAQMTRAILLASRIAALRNGMRARTATRAGSALSGHRAA